MTKGQDSGVTGVRFTRRRALALAGPLALRNPFHDASNAPTDKPDGDAACSLFGNPHGDAPQDFPMEPERAFIEGVLVPASGAPGKAGEESNTSLCHWLLGRQPPFRATRLRLIYELRTFFDRYPSGAHTGVINTTRIVDPQNRLFESYSANARVRCRDGGTRVLLTATVEERERLGTDDTASIHFITKKFVYSEKTWSLEESHVRQMGRTV